MRRIYKSTLKSIFIILIMAVTLQACKNDKKSNDTQPNTTQVSDINTITMNTTQAETILDTYLDLSQAFIASQPKLVQEKADKLVHAYHQEENDIVLLAVTISEIEDIEEQRAIFYQLSQRMETFISENLKSGEIYKQYCPMAFDDKAAFWFSTSKEILNPYFGDKMLHCGSIKKTIK